MKTQKKVLEGIDQLKGEKVGMSIDVSAMAHVMSILTELYSDVEMAVLREYATNALDAHVESGNTDPIWIELPTPLMPYLKIRDQGIGLNDEDIRDIYSKYGASTKRDSNDVVGMLGLGCKSALAYTDQFTLTGIKDGICTMVSVSREEDGSGSMTLVDQYETDEPNGVEISIPVKQHNDFEDKAEELFRFWKPGTVLVNGEEPKHVDGFWIADDLLLTQDVDEDTIVMGNVPYPMSDGYSSYKNWHTVAFVEIGTVYFTPSRESLMFNDTTKATIEIVKDRVKTELEAAIQKQINDATTARDAMILVRDAGTMGYGKIEAKFQNKDIPREYKFDDRIIVLTGVKEYRRKDWDKYETVGLSTILDSVFFYGYDSDSWSPYKRQKLEQWIEKQGENYDRPKNYVLLNHIPRDLRFWLRKDQIEAWADPDAEKIVREKTMVGNSWNQRPSGSYSGYVNGVFEDIIEADEIDTSKPLFYYKQDKSAWGHEPTVEIIKVLEKDATIIRLAKNRINKFLRDFPMAQEVDEYNKQAQANWHKSLTEDEKIYLHYENNYNSSQSIPSFLDADKIDDPELKRVVRIRKSNPKKLMELNRLFDEAPKFSFKDPSEKYPLLAAAAHKWYYRSSVSDKDETHLYLYINAAYAAERTV